MLHTMYFADEVRNFGEIDRGQGAKIRDGEMDLALKLIDGLSTEAFDPTEFTDEYRQRVLDMIQAKVEGKEIITLSPEAPKAQVIDLMEALKESLTRKIPRDKKPLAKAKKDEPTPAPRRAQAGKK